MDLIELSEYLRGVGEEAPSSDELPAVEAEEEAFAVVFRDRPGDDRLWRDGDNDEPSPIWLSSDDLPLLPPGLQPGATVVERRTGEKALRGNWESAVHACAWYRQIAFNGPAFGIFIRQDCMFDLAEEMAPWAFPVGTVLSVGHADLLLRLAFNYLYLHEQFHHKVESLAIRLAVSERRPVYTPYWRGAYAPHRGTNQLLEEALANADAYHRFAEPRYAAVGAPPWVDPVRSARAFLVDHFRLASPGYSQAVHYLAGRAFAEGQDQLSAVVSQGAIPPPPDWSRWRFATHMLRGLFPITSSIWIVVKVGSWPVVPVSAPPLSISTKEVERLLPRLHYRRVPSEGKGSHGKWEPISGVGNKVELPQDRDIPKGTLNQIAKDLGFVNGHQLALACRGKGQLAAP